MPLFEQVLADPAVIAKFKATGSICVGDTPQEFRRFILSETGKVGEDHQGHEPEAGGIQGPTPEALRASPCRGRRRRTGKSRIRGDHAIRAHLFLAFLAGIKLQQLQVEELPASKALHAG